MSRAYTHLPWIYQGAAFDESRVTKAIDSFVYLITDTQTGLKYIGKKSFWSMQTFKAPGKEPRRKRVESDWRKYYSSNLDIIAGAKGGNGARYTREILHLCPTKGTATYYEAKEIMIRDALLSPDYMNYYLEAKVNGGHVKELVK